MTTEHGAAERRAEMRAIERAEALPYTTIPPSRPWEPFLFAGFVTLVFLGVDEEGLIWTLLIDAVAIIGLIVYLRYRIRLNKSMPNAAAAPPEIKPTARHCPNCGVQPCGSALESASMGGHKGCHLP